MSKGVGILVLGTMLVFAVEACVTNGVVPGEWTRDFSAAKKAASESGLPVLVQFSGQDWSASAERQEEHIFSTAEWKRYAVSNVVQVQIECSSQVLSEYEEQNRTVYTNYGVDSLSLPTWFLITDHRNGPFFIREDDTVADVKARLDALISQAPIDYVLKDEFASLPDDEYDLIPVVDSDPVFIIPEKGVVPGEWTTDVQAAKRYAGDHKLPVLLCYPGPEWATFDRHMEGLFMQPEWKKYVASQIVMVLVDPPEGRSLFPLEERFGLEKFPMYLLLDADWETQLGTLDADWGLASALNNLKILLRMRPETFATFAGSLSPEDLVTLSSLKAAYDNNQSEEQAIEEDSKRLAERICGLGCKMADAEEALRLFYIEHGPKDRLQEYRELQALLKQKELELKKRAASGEYRAIDATLDAEMREIRAKLELF